MRFSQRARAPLVRLGTALHPEGGKIDAGLKMAIDLAIHSLRRAAPGDGPVAVEEEDAYAFFKARAGYPVNPFNPEELAGYMRALDAAIGAEIVGQERMRRDLLHLFQDVIVGAKKDMGVIALLGPTGAGKSEAAKLLARHGFNNPRALLRIDMTEYRSHDASLNKLFGAVGGLVTSTERQGILCDWFDDPSQGKYGGVVLIDEAERGDPGVWERLMEFFDTGTFVGGDGRRRQARRHVVILTSNRGDKVLFPDSIVHWSDGQIAAYAERVEEKTLKRLFQMKLTGRDEFQIPTPVLNRIDRYTRRGAAAERAGRRDRAPACAKAHGRDRQRSRSRRSRSTRASRRGSPSIISPSPTARGRSSAASPSSSTRSRSACSPARSAPRAAGRSPSSSTPTTRPRARRAPLSTGRSRSRSSCRRPAYPIRCSTRISRARSPACAKSCRRRSGARTTPWSARATR